ncbi:MAG: hypothetical protein U1F48_19655 [Burkholderiales bacterium]
MKQSTQAGEHVYDVELVSQASDYAVTEVGSEIVAAVGGGASANLSLSNCFGTAGTAGTVGTAGGTFGSVGTAGTFGSSNCANCASSSSCSSPSPAPSPKQN